MKKILIELVIILAIYKGSKNLYSNTEPFERINDIAFIINVLSIVLIIINIIRLIIIF